MSDLPGGLGATCADGATTFRVWAPDRRAVDLVVQERIRPLRRESSAGYWTGTFDDAPSGTLYRYRLDGDPALTFPDPVSRFQPAGVHGPSEVVDPRAYIWGDSTWMPPPREQLVFYELHVGTFTAEGTFDGVRARLRYLKALGVTAIELMPIGDFPGNRNWGYDGVCIYAPARCYGRPDALRRLVDEAHQIGLAVFLDVVYNHLGPDGAYAHAYSADYFTSRHRTAWGSAMNLDGPRSAEVRRFFFENAVHWIREYHIDGLRLDATHALHDDGTPHFLAELSRIVRAQGERSVVLVAEDHRNLASLVRSPDEGGLGLDAVWADDFHHEARVHTAGDREGYYGDFTGNVADLATTLRQGWFFTGQYSTHLRQPRGTSVEGLSPAHFVFCIQNHDQIGNRALGERLHHQVDAATYRALSVILLMAPQLPLLFMGQEWAAASPFLFFTEHEPELGQRVTAGRRAEFRAFSAFADAATWNTIPDPQDVTTFERSRLDWDELARTPHRFVRRLYERLLHLRKGARRSAPGHRCVSASALDAHSLTFTVAHADGAAPLTVVARLSGGAGRVVVPGNARLRRVAITTEDVDVSPDPLAVQLDGEDVLTVTFARPGAVVLRGVSFAA